MWHIRIRARALVNAALAVIAVVVGSVRHVSCLLQWANRSMFGFGKDFVAALGGV